MQVYYTKYYTINRTHHEVNITWEDLIDSVYIDALPQEKEEKLNRSYMPTVTRKQYHPEYCISAKECAYVMNMCEKLRAFKQKHDWFYKDPDASKHYHTFFIPKHSGGMRRIDAPSDELKAAQTELRDIMKNDMQILYHTSAFAYIEGRSTLDAVKKHQQNNSNWFLKTDFSNFFGNTTKGFVMSQFERIYPVSLLFLYKENKQLLSDVLDLCFLNGGLPQGSVTAPFITNAMMIPIDHELANTLHKNNMVYTRYADDMIISSYSEFYWENITDEIRNVLRKWLAPFDLKDEKTHYGSKAGSNWILGVMLNKDNNMTIGAKKLREFNAMVSNFVLDHMNGKADMWPKDQVMYLQGLISYYRMIQNDKVDEVLNKYDKKYKYNVRECIRMRIKG